MTYRDWLTVLRIAILSILTVVIYLPLLWTTVHRKGKNHD